jgi:hypothetical protein
VEQGFETHGPADAPPTLSQHSMRFVLPVFDLQSPKLRGGGLGSRSRHSALVCVERTIFPSKRC